MLDEQGRDFIAGLRVLLVKTRPCGDWAAANCTSSGGCRHRRRRSSPSTLFFLPTSPEPPPGGWGVWRCCWRWPAGRAGRVIAPDHAVPSALLTALLLLAAAALAAPLWAAQPLTLALSSINLTAAGFCALVAALATLPASAGEAAPSAFCVALLFAGRRSRRSAWCRCSRPPGPTATGSPPATRRPRGGNLRQPNHPAACCWVDDRRRLAGRLRLPRHLSRRPGVRGR